MMRKVKVKSPKNSSTLKRMNINLYGDNVTAPKLELPTAQFGASIIGGTSQPDPGNFRSKTKTESIERNKAIQKARDQSRAKTAGLGAAGLVTGALSSIPIIGGAFEGLNEKVQEKDKTGVAGITSGIGKAAVGTTSAVLSGGTMGTGDIAEGVGDVMGGSSEIAYNKGNDKKSERLGKAGQAFDTIAPIADMASGLAGGIKGAEGMFKGPEGFKGGMKSLLGGTPSAEGGMKGVMKGFNTLDSFDTFDMNTTSEVNSLPFAKFGTKLPLEMKLIPEGGKVIDGYSHERGGVLTTYGGKALAETEGGEVITKIREERKEGAREEGRGGGVVFSDTTINPETGKPFSNDAKKVIKIKDENTRRLAEEELYRKQERAKRMQGLVNEGEMAKYDKKLRKYEDGGDLTKKQKNILKNQIKNGTLSFINNADISEMLMKGPNTAEIDGERQVVESPRNSFTDLGLRSQKVLPKSGSLKLDKFDFKIGAPSIQGDIYSSTEKTATGKPKIKSLSERLFRNADGSLNYNNENLIGEEKKDGEDGKGNLTPGDITQLAGNMVAPLANFAAIKEIGRNTARLGRDRSITKERKISTADIERAIRQESAATRAGLTQLGSDAMKSALTANATKALQDTSFQEKMKNEELGMLAEQARTQRSQFNVGQADKEAIDKQTRKDLATTTGLTAAEQTGKALVDLGLTKNQGLTNAAQLKVLQEAFPDYTINADNMKSIIRALSSGDKEKILKYRKPEGE